MIEPMGNMPVIKDLVTDMESTHWTKIRRVTPWLLPHGEAPEREYIVEPESMIDITQSMACIQCGACVSSCLSMEADPDFIGPAALAKAYRFVGDPRDAETVGAPARPRRGPARDLRLHPLLQLRRRLPQGRGADGPDHAPAPQGRRRGDRGPQHRPRPRDGLRQDHREEGHPRRGAAAAGVLRARRQRQAETEQTGDQGNDRLDADRDPRHQDRQDALAAEADPRRPPQASRRRPGRRQGDLQARRGAQRGIQPVHQGRGGRAGRDRGRGAPRARPPTCPPPARRPRDGEQIKVAYWPGCVSRGFTPELHGSMALVAEQLGIELVDPRPRQLLRRRRHRRAQPGAGRHAQRPHLRARPADRALDDEHLLDLPGRAVGVPAAARRRLRLPRPRQRGALRPGPLLREGQGRLRPTRTSSGCWSRTTASTASPRRSSGRSPASGSAPSTAATSSARRSASATASSPTATSTWRR